MKNPNKEIVFKNQYYEAIIQLRPFNEEVYKFIDKKIKERGNVFIAKIIYQKTGIDIYISSNKFAQSLGKKLKQTFKGELKISTKLFSRDRQTSKEKHRVTILFRLLPTEQEDELFSQ